MNTYWALYDPIYSSACFSTLRRYHLYVTLWMKTGLLSTACIPESNMKIAMCNKNI